MRIGYQGDVGSNNEDAAIEFAKTNFKHSTVEFIPLISSRAVIDAILSGAIDYGVCAVRSFTSKEAAKVEETTNALKDSSYLLEAVDVLQLPIHHCLYKLPGAKIDTIASHKQALIRTKNKRAKDYRHLKEKEERDTAWCAKALRSGDLPSNMAVICKKETGEKYSLEIVELNIEDEPIRTEFVLYKKYED